MTQVEHKRTSRIQRWPAFKVSLDLSASQRSWLASRAGLTGIDCEDHRLLSAAVKNLVSQEMAKSEALQRAKQQSLTQGDVK